MMDRKEITCLLAILALPGLARNAAAQSEAESLSASFRKAAQQVLPAVVTIRAQGPLGRIDSLPRLPSLEPRLPEELVPGRVFPDPYGRELGGSGVIIDAEKGLVLTNDHVVPAARNLMVTLSDGRQRIVKRVRRDPQGDLALLIIDPQGLRQAAWGDSASLEIGDWVLAVGQPFGLSGTVSAGIISGKGRRLGPASMYEDLLQTDAAISTGSSGGPLVNLKGEIVGITLALKTYNGGFEGVGLVIPSQRARRVAADLAEFGHVQRAYLGIEIRPVASAVAARLDQPGAVEIGSIAPGSAAATAGLRPGDVILKINGQPVSGPGSVRSAIELAPAGSRVTLTVVRGNETLEIPARPEMRRESEPALVPGPQRAPASGAEDPAELRPAPEPDRGEHLEARAPTRFPELGLRLEEPTAELRQRFALAPDLKGLVVVGVESDSPADQGGLEVGMTITDVDNRRVASLGDFRAALARRTAGHDLVIRIVKEGRPGFRVILGASGTGPAPSAEPQPDPPPAVPPLFEPPC